MSLLSLLQISKTFMVDRGEVPVVKGGFSGYRGGGVFHASRAERVRQKYHAPMCSGLETPANGEILLIGARPCPFKLEVHRWVKRSTKGG